jgi:hypothetical protein
MEMLRKRLPLENVAATDDLANGLAVFKVGQSDGAPWLGMDRLVIKYIANGVPNLAISESAAI